MIQVRRLLAVGALLGAAVALTSTEVVWGDARDKALAKWRQGEGNIKVPKVAAPAGADEDEKGRFEGVPAVAYQAGQDDALLALQVQPTLADAPAQPTDYVVVIDTSASKAQGPLAQAVLIAQHLADALGTDDRLALWTANLKPRDISRGLKTAKDLADAFKVLNNEVPLGAVDLKKALTEALASVEPKAGRRAVLVFLGDGKSIAQPLDTDARAALAAAMVKKNVGFFAVPLGQGIDAQNIHALVTGTGGKVVRLGGTKEKTEAFVARLKKDVAEPVLHGAEITLPATVTDALPTRLPPLRRDVPTLVLGKLKPGTKTVAYTVKGTLAGKAVKDERTVTVPASDDEHFFLAGVYAQWRFRRDLPTLLPADRALGSSHKQNQLAVEDLLAKAEMAMEENRLDVAEKLYEQARGLAPHSTEARGGLRLVSNMRAGKKDRQAMLAELRLNNVDRELMRIEQDGGRRRVIDVAQAGADKKDDKPADDAPARDPLEDVKQRREIARQQANLAVTEAIRQANRLVRSNPDEAYNLLKETLEGVRTNADLDAAVIASLGTRLSRAMQSVAVEGQRAKRDIAEALALRAAADARLDLRRAQEQAQDRIRERMRVFHNLMDQAREEEAYRVANTLRADLINQGLPVPPAVTAGYQVALNGYHLREVQELRRVREEKFLATMLEVERSHVPFPDEPPVEFPNAAVMRRLTRGQFDNWRDFSKWRIARYSVATFGSDAPGRLFELRDTLNKTVDFQGLDDPKTTLLEALDQLAKVHRVTFDVNEKAFKYEMLNDVLKTEVAATPIPPIRASLGTVIKKILSRVNVPSGATYVIRRDVIEITTGQFASAEKAIRVYPVSDLVNPIPNSVNLQSVGQQATILGTLGALGIVGQAGGLALGALGAGGLQLGALGGAGLGALGALGGALGGAGLGALGAVGGALGGAGGLAVGGAGGLQIGGPGGFGMQLGGMNLGVGGGQIGFTGGQLGQFGNLGGQFGLQGGTQEQLLITLITQVVGRQRDWAPRYNPITGQPLNPLDDEKTDGGDLFREDNNIGYYPPALALVVKAPSTIHTRESSVILQGAGAGAGGMVAAPRRGDGGGGVFVDGRRPAAAGNGGDAKGPKILDKNLDPKQVWQDALARGVSDPGLIIATADFLAMNNKFDHAAEFLRANLRQGVVVKPWVYKSLAIALRESGGSAEDIERAEVSSADLQPLDSQGYLVAARGLAEDKNYERALAFCRQAAELAPGSPHAFAEAARFAEMAGDGAAMQWAVGHLLRQDWPVGNDELQRGARERVEALAKRLKPAEGQRLLTAVKGQQRRDLVIKLLWQGDADLDLKVLEPSGSVAAALSRQTIGGGTLIADALASNGAETYVAGEAFSGDYQVQIDRVWGKPLGNKAQLKIIMHQGTPQETEQLVTVKLTSNHSTPVKVTLANGRRTEAAYVPPPAARASLEDVVSPLEGRDAVLAKLRRLSDPELTGFERGMQGGMASSGIPPARAVPFVPKHHEKDRTVYQNKVSSFVANSMDVTAQAVLSADRQSVRLSVRPVFNTASDKPVKVTSPVFPGAGK